MDSFYLKWVIKETIISVIRYFYSFHVVLYNEEIRGGTIS